MSVVLLNIKILQSHCRTCFRVQRKTTEHLVDTGSLSFLGDTTQKGKIMGIFRSLGALARATGPFFSCASKFHYFCIVDVLSSLHPSITFYLSLNMLSNNLLHSHNYILITKS